MPMGSLETPCRIGNTLLPTSMLTYQFWSYGPASFQGRLLCLHPASRKPPSSKQAAIALPTPKFIQTTCTKWPSSRWGWSGPLPPRCLVVAWRPLSGHSPVARTCPCHDCRKGLVKPLASNMNFFIGCWPSCMPGTLSMSALKLLHCSKPSHWWLSVSAMCTHIAY